MAAHRPLVPATCLSRCIVLSDTSKAEGLREALPVEHFPCAWRIVQRHARSLVVRSLERYPLGRLKRQLAKACRHAGEFCSDGVRHQMATDADLVDELLQAVALELYKATLRGKVYAELPAIFKWASLATYRIVVPRAKSAAMLAMSRVPPRRPDSSLPLDAEEFGASISTAGSGYLDKTPTLRTVFLHALRDSAFTARLSAKGREVLVHHLRGRSDKETAGHLGVSRMAVSLRLMRAKRQLLAWASGLETDGSLDEWNGS